MQTKEALTPTSTNIWSTYTMNVRQRTIMGGVANENFISATIKKALVGSNDVGYVFNLNVVNRKQSNLDGIRGMENDLAELQKELVVQTDFSGAPVRIMNLEPIRDAWSNSKLSFEKKFKDENGLAEILSETDTFLNNNKVFTENFSESEIGTLFFPPIYGELSETGETTSQQKIFNGFFSESPLPLTLTTVLKERHTRDHKIQVQRKGNLDKDQFDHYAVRKFFRKLADNLKLAAPVTADYLETYDLNPYHAVTHAGQLLGVRVEALFSFEQIARVTPVKKAV